MVEGGTFFLFFLVCLFNLPKKEGRARKVLTSLTDACQKTTGRARTVENVQWIYLKQQLLHPPQLVPLCPCRTSEIWIRVNISHPTPCTTMVKVYTEIHLCNIIRLSTHRPSSSGNQPSKQLSVPLSVLWGPSLFVQRH